MSQVDKLNKLQATIDALNAKWPKAYKLRKVETHRFLDPMSILHKGFNKK